MRPILEYDWIFQNVGHNRCCHHTGNLFPFLTWRLRFICKVFDALDYHPFCLKIMSCCIHSWKKKTLMSVRTTSYILMRLMSKSRARTCDFLTRTISFIRNSMRFFARLIRVFRLAYTRAVLYFLSILKIIVLSKLIKIRTLAVCKHAHHRKKLVSSEI